MKDIINSQWLNAIENLLLVMYSSLWREGRGLKYALNISSIQIGAEMLKQNKFEIVSGLLNIFCVMTILKMIVSVYLTYVEIWQFALQ